MANYTSVIASNICDAAGNKMASGTVSFQATDAANQPLNFQVGGGGQVVTTPATAAITAGVIANGFQVADSANTTPAGILYRVTITDTTLNRVVVTYSLVTVTGATFSLDTYSQTGAAVLPPTGGSVNGPLSVIGNLNVTGSFNPGTLGNITSTGTILAKNIEGVRYADQFAGADIGAQINAAYADLPATGGVIYVPQKPDGSAYSFTTPILFNTVGKYVLLQGIGCGGDSGSSVIGGVCLNYTASSGTALTMDYVPLARSASTAVHGLSNIALINTQTQSKGGPVANTAVGLSCGSTNQGCYEATMQNVTIQGFNVGWSSLNDKAVDIAWFNPQFLYNGTAILLSSPTGVQFFGGTFAGNGKSFKTNAAGSTPEIQIFGTQFFNNTDLIIDATATTGSNTAIFDCYSPHFENSGVDSANYVSGNVNLHLFGGLVEDDNGTGTINWLFSLSGSSFTSYGVEYACNRTCTNLLVANSPLRGVLAGHDRSNGHFTNYIGGANAAFISNQMSPGPSSVAAIPTTFEYIKSPTVEVGTGNGFIIDENGAPGGIAGKAVFYANSGTHRVLLNSNAGSFDNVVTAGSTDTLTNKTLTGPIIGTGTALARYARYSLVLSPASVAANTTAEQSFASAVTSGDVVVGISKPTAQAGLGIVGHRTSGTTLFITFSNNTASPITPTASETYQVVAVQ